MSIIRCNSADFLELSKEILEKGGSLRFRVHGESMRPFIKTGDIVEVKRIEISDVLIGDVILYLNVFKKIAIHRVIKKKLINNKIALMVKGDNTLLFEQNIYPEDVLGKVVVIENEKKKIRFDRKQIRIKAYLYAIKTLLIRIIGINYSKIRHKIFGNLLRRLQSYRIYRYLARKIVSGKIIFRIAAAEDALSLANLFRAYHRQFKEDALVGVFKEYLQCFLKNSGYCIVAEKNNKIIAAVVVNEHFLCGSIIYPGWWVENLFVLWYFRRIGLGEYLMKLAFETAQKRGISELKMVIPEKNARSFKLTKKLGCEQISIITLEEYFKKEESEKKIPKRIILAKYLYA